MPSGLQGDAVFNRKIKLFSWMGFEVGIDPSWVILAVLVAWSLSAGYFPYTVADLPTSTYWMMGIIGALGLFASIVFHELCHSILARRSGLHITGITLFIFGGVAEMGEEPRSARDELLIAGVGPLSSFFMAALFYVIANLGAAFQWPEPVIAVLLYLSMINLILAIFNLIPAFPLDGGRMLRAALWHWKQNLRWATRVASTIGAGFAYFLFFVAVMQVLTGNFIGGMWMFLIGMFLLNAARMSYQQLVVRKALEGEPLSRFMSDDPVTVPLTATVQELVDDYVYQHHYKLFPVVENGDLSGCITTQKLKTIPRDQWRQMKVHDLMDSCNEANSISPDTDAVKALSIMQQNNASRLMVVQDQKLVGIVSLKDMLNFLSMKVELDQI
jgi:Zn-dependent protease/CBS domain-containing protein